MTIIKEMCGYSLEEIKKALEPVYDLIVEAHTTTELLEIDSLIGISDYFDWADGWEAIVLCLRELHSPYYSVYSLLCHKWVELEGE